MPTKSNPQEPDTLELDRVMMRRCIGLSAKAVTQGEFPFAAVICEGGRVVVETTNQVAQSADLTRHAELIAVSQAQKILGRKDLSACTLYSSVEPCAMCSFPIRETRIGRIVYAMTSPLMGGFSKWNVLRDTEIADVLPEAFGPAPELIAGLCRDEAEKVWRDWNPIAWAVIKRRGCFGEALPGHDHLPAIPARLSLFGKLMTLRKSSPLAAAAAAIRSLDY